MLLCMAGLSSAAWGFTFSSAPGSPYAFEGSPDSAAVGDFNGDGLPDFVVASELFCPHGCDEGVASVFVADGHGGFRLASGNDGDAPIQLGQGPVLLETGDFNGDGKPDLVASEGGELWILLGNGDGTFAPTSGSPMSDGHDARQAVVADFNRDGRADLAVVNGDDTVSVLLGAGDGTFASAPGSPLTVGSSSGWGIAAGDFNGDGNQDLVVSSGTLGSSGSVSVLLGKGDGSFGPAPDSPIDTGGTPPATGMSEGLAVTDLNGDGRPDVAVVSDKFGSDNAGDNSGAVDVLLGRGDGSFAPAPGSPIVLSESLVQGVVPGDFNSDGKPDLAFAAASGLDLLLGDGAGGFKPAHGSPFKVDAGGIPPSPAVLGSGRFDGRPGVLLTPATCCTIHTGYVSVMLAPLPSDPPTAVLAAAPNRVPTAAPVKLDASQSSDPLDRRIVDYRWDVGNGRFDHDTGTSPMITWRYIAPRTDHVRVLITNSAGGTAIASAQVVVVRPLPPPRNAAISGYVKICGGPAPGRCRVHTIRLCKAFRGCVTSARVAAINSKGQRVAIRKLKRGRFRLHLVPGRYTIELLGDGKRAHGRIMQRKKVTARRNRTATVRFLFAVP
jgi:hypothetical protein